MRSFTVKDLRAERGASLLRGAFADRRRQLDLTRITSDKMVNQA